MIDPVGVFGRDLARSRPFYEKTLGLECAGEDEDEIARMATFRSDRQEIRLFEPKRRSPAPIDPVSLRLPPRRWTAKAGLEVGGPYSSRGTHFLGRPHVGVPCCRASTSRMTASTVCSSIGGPTRRVKIPPAEKRRYTAGSAVVRGDATPVGRPR